MSDTAVGINGCPAMLQTYGRGVVFCERLAGHDRQSGSERMHLNQRAFAHPGAEAGWGGELYPVSTWEPGEAAAGSEWTRPTGSAPAWFWLALGFMSAVVLLTAVLVIGHWA